MNIYTDFYNVTHDGFHRVIEFKCLSSKYREIKKQLAFANSDNEKMNLFNSLKSNGEIKSLTVHLPTFGGRYPSGKPA